MSPGQTACRFPGAGKPAPKKTTSKKTNKKRTAETLRAPATDPTATAIESRPRPTSGPVQVTSSTARARSEVWRSVVGVPGYEVSSLGRARSLNRCRACTAAHGAVNKARERHGLALDLKAIANQKYAEIMAGEEVA